MERRQEVRFPVDVPVEFTVLGPDAQRIAGQIHDVSEGGIRLSVATNLIPGSFLRVQLDDSLVYAEVRYCCKFSNRFLCGLLVERVLVGESDLSQLLASTLPDVQRVTASTEFN